ncbi:hypothetical protein [Aquimonas sp.]|uniref:hypothetical protein n=1 Tax=Aquimonas sp. TaxID=1872588 RepID=UPI0037C02066
MAAQLGQLGLQLGEIRSRRIDGRRAHSSSLRQARLQQPDAITVQARQQSEFRPHPIELLHQRLHPARSSRGERIEQQDRRAALVKFAFAYTHIACEARPRGEQRHRLRRGGENAE